MTIQALLDNLGKANIAGDVDKETLGLLADQVINDYQADLDSMLEWSDGIEEGREIAKQETAARSEPFEGASNYKSPAILEACRQFGDRAIVEVIRGRNLVKADVIGKDPQNIKKETAERVSEFMNWQINYDMDDWRGRQETLVYEAPATGTVFKETYFDSINKKNVSELIHYPDFAVNQATTCIEEAKSFTKILPFSRSEITERIAADLWSDVQIYPETSMDGENGNEGSNEAEGVVDAADNDQKFLEQYCFYDLDGDGYQEPYVVTVHENSRKIVRIAPRYTASGVVVKNKMGDIDNIQTFFKDAVNNAAEFNPELFDLVKIKAECNLTKYGFIKPIDGTFLDVGYLHLLAPLAKAENVTTNQLMDAGSLANLQGGFLARGFRKRLGSLRMKPGSWEQTDISAQDLQTGMMPHQFKEPSVTLLNLRDQLTQRIQTLVASMDLQGVLAPNAPATTTLALVQEAMMPMSAILQRFIAAESKEFAKLFELNREYADPEQYIKVLDDPNANWENDFNSELIDVKPTANPEMSSKMQRIQMADALMFQMQNVLMSGGDPKPIMEMYFDALGADELIDKVYPSIEDMTEQQKAKAEAQDAEQQKQEALLDIEIDHKEREAQRKDVESNLKVQETNSKLRKDASEILLNLEKAESEEVKNRISIYTTEQEESRKTIETIGASLNGQLPSSVDGSPAGVPAVPSPE